MPFPVNYVTFAVCFQNLHTGKMMRRCPHLLGAAPWQASGSWTIRRKWAFKERGLKEPRPLPVLVRGSAEGLHNWQYEINKDFFLTVNHA